MSNPALTLTAAAANPDLLVTNIRTVSPYPEPGDQVIFLASVLNRGTGTTSVGGEVVVSFTVRGNEVARARPPKHTIPVGGMALAVAFSESGSAKLWTAAEGEWPITAAVVEDWTRAGACSRMKRSQVYGPL